MNYGGGDYGGAGGYLPSQGGSQASPGSASKGARDNTLRPVTIKQIHDSTQLHPDAESRIDGREISHLTIVAKVRNVTEQSTNITYVVEDGTGVLEVKQWIDADAAAAAAGGESAASRLNGSYIRVLGGLKIFNDKKHLAAHSIRRVTDYNEVSYHLLECTAVHLAITRGPAGQGDVTMGGTGAGAGARTGTGAVAEAPVAQHDKLPAGASMGARRVYDTIRAAPESNEGVHVQLISQKSGLKMAEVTKAVDELLALGVAFSTLDENHIAVMDF